MRKSLLVLLFLLPSLSALAYFIPNPQGMETFWLKTGIQAACLLGGLFLLRYADKGIKRAYLLLLAWTCIIAVYSPAASGLAALVRICSPFAFYLFAQRYLSDCREQALKVIALSAVIPLCIAFGQWAWSGFALDPYTLRLDGPYIAGPVTLSQYLLIVLAVLFSIQIRFRRTLIAATSLVLLLTYTRAMWFAAALLIVWLLRRHWKRVLVGVTVLLAIVLSASVFHERLRDLEDEFQAWNYESKTEGSAGLRIAITAMMFPRVLEAPIIGHGFGSLALDYSSTEDKVAPHNDFLYLAYEAGLPAMLLYLWLWFRVLRRCERSNRITGVAVPLVLLLNFAMFFHNPLFASDVQDYLFLLVGLSQAPAPVIASEFRTLLLKAGHVRMSAGRTAQNLPRI